MELHDVLNDWTGGQLLAFSGLDGRTDYHHGLCLRTAFDGIGLEIKLPGQGRLTFGRRVAGEVLLTGDAFDVTTDNGRSRGAMLDAGHLLIEGHCDVDVDDPALRVMKAGKRTLLASAELADADKLQASLDEAIVERLAWLRSLELPEEIYGLRRTCLAKALSIMKTQVYWQEGQMHRRWTTPDRWPHRAMWLWDSAFHAIGWRHVDPQIAREALGAVLDCQTTDGFIAHMHTPDGSSSITQPPVLALAAALIDQEDHDDKWLRKIYPKLAAYVRWDLDHRDSDGGGLCEWQVNSDPHNRCDESGMDNSPRFDVGQPLDAVDFNALLALECEVLSLLAGELGKDDEADRWSRTCDEIVDRINDHLWSEKRGLYMDAKAGTDQRTGVLAASGFLPLICGAPDKGQSRRIEQHLSDESTFGGPLPVASVAAGQVADRPRDMWRGPVWVNLNWLIARGFDRYAMTRTADRIRRATLDEIERQFATYATFFEYYDDRKQLDPPELPRKGRCAPEESPYHQVLFDYGWSATLYVDMVMTSL
jgi:glycogen debranching enzyme